jgi:hypothetical protein
MGTSPSPELLVLRESARALGQGLLLPLRAAGYLARAERLRRELRADLALPAAVLYEQDQQVKRFWRQGQNLAIKAPQLFFAQIELEV